MKEARSEEDVKALQRMVDLFRAIDVNSLFNAYAIENVIFGDLKPGDKIPFEKFIDDLGLNAWRVHSIRDCIVGIAIVEGERIADEEMDFFERESFIFHMNYIFDTAPYSRRKEDDENGLRPFNRAGLSDYIMRLFPLFREILATDVEYDYFGIALPFSSRAAETACYEKIARFMASILTRGLRQGRCVDRYLKDVPYIPYYVRRLLKEKKGRVLLANSDPESLEFRLAILSTIHFMNAGHTRLFERKTRKWAGE